MTGARFGPSLDADELTLIEGRQRDHIGHPRLALGERPGLVEHDGLDARGELEARCLLEQDPLFRPHVGGHHDRRGRGEAERVGARDDDRGHGKGQREEHSLLRDGEPVQERDQARAHRDDHEVVRGAIGDPLSGCLRALRRFHQTGDPGQSRVRADVRRPEADRAGLVHRARDDRASGLLLDGHRLAGDHRFVDRGVAVDDHAVHRGTLAGLEHDDVSDRDLRRHHAHDLPVPLDVGFARCELEELAHRVGRAAPGAHLHPVTEQQERREHDRRLVEGLATDREGESDAEDVAHQDAERDEHAHVEHARPDRSPRADVEDARRPQRDRRAEREQDPVGIDRRWERAASQEQRPERRVGDHREREHQRDEESAAHVRFHRRGHPRVGHVVAHRGVTAVRRGLRRGVMHRLVRAHRGVRKRYRVAEVAVRDLRAQRRGVRHPGMHRDVRDLALEIDVDADDVRQLPDRRPQVFLTAGAEDLIEPHLDGLRRRRRRGRDRFYGV